VPQVDLARVTTTPAQKLADERPHENSKPDGRRDVAVLHEHRVRVRVLRLALEPVAALENEDAFSGRRQLSGECAAARAAADNDDPALRDQGRGLLLASHDELGAYSIEFEGTDRLWRQDPSGRDLYGQGGLRQGALPLSRWSLDRSEDRGWARARIAEAQRRRWRAYREGRKGAPLGPTVGHL
jgi:hypothetical protein